MRHHRPAWIMAAALIVVPFSPAAADAASPVPARVVAPADVATPTVVKHVSTDVDGDGTRDSVTLSYLGSDTFELVVTTTMGKRSKVRFTSHVNASLSPAAETWYGASAMDGRKGSELIVRTFTKRTSATHVNVLLGVYTWRSGKLVAESAPASVWGRVWTVNEGSGFDVRGYSFFTRSGHRYVDATQLATKHKQINGWKGHVTRSVWRSGKWVTVWTHKARTVKDYPDRWGQVGIAGPKLLVGQVNVDVNADGAADLVLFYRDGMSHYLVTAAGSAYGFHSNDGSPFIGAAQLDGAPGYEVLVTLDPEDPEWEVLTWSGGRLAPERPAPLLYGATVDSGWHGSSDEDITNLRFYTEAGASCVETGWISYENSILTDPVNFATSVWQDGAWVKKSEQQRVLTDAERATFHRGFTVDSLVTP
jgi:hypothetical protein